MKPGTAIATVLLTLCCWLVSAAALSQSDDELSDLYEVALAYYHEGSLKSADIEVRNILQMDSRHLGARLLKGEIELVSGDGAAAQASFETARRLGAADELYLTQLAEALIQQRKFEELYADIKPGVRDPALEASVHIAHGKALLEQGKEEAAEIQFSIAEKLWPQAPEPRVGYAIIARRRGDLDAANQFLAQATSETPEYAQAWYIRGTLARARGDSDAALNYFSRALERNPYYVVARNARISLLMQAGRDDEALEDIQFVLNFRPYDPQANYQYALLLAKDGEPEAADLAMRRVSNALSTLGTDYIYTHPPSLFLYGLLKFQEKDFPEAKRAFTQYLAFVPGAIGGRQLLAVLYAREKNFAEVIRLIEPAVAASPDNPQLLAMLGQARMQMRQVAEATALFERAVELTPFDEKIKTQLALTRLATGLQTQAISELEEVLQFSEESSNVAVMLGFIYLRKGDAATALEWGNRVLSSNPASVAGENLLGAAYLELGRTADAKASFQRAVKSDPADATAHYNLAALASADGDREQARSHLESITRSNGREVEAMARLARMAMEDGDVKAAINWYEKLRIAEPNALMNQIELFEIYLALGRMQEANWLVSDLVSRFPDHLRVNFALGRARLAEGKNSEAAVAFARMARLAGNNAPELEKIAGLQLSANDIKGAHWSLEKAITGQPDYLPALESLCELELRLGNTAAALEIATNIQTLYPEKHIGYQLAGSGFLQTDQVAKAIAVFEEGLAKEPGGELERAVFLARLKAGEGNSEAQDRALKQYDAWISTNPLDFEARRTYAGALYQISRYQDAVAHYTILLEERPRDAQLHNAVSYIYLQLGDQRAYTHARQAYSLAPNDPLILDTYGWLLFQRGESEEALGYLRQASLRSPNISELHYHLGAVLHDLRRFKEARLELEASLVRGHDFEGAEQARALLLTIQES